MALLLKGARLVDPAAGLDEVADIVVRDGRIEEIGPSLSMAKGVTRDLSGMLVVPGLVDLHVHLRDPGQEYKEDIVSGAAAAAAGGFTDIVCMPNTVPVCDSAAQVSYILEKAAAHPGARVHVAGALTAGSRGEALAEMGDMARAGAVAFSDDGYGVQDSGMMRRAMDYARGLGKPLLSHCQFADITAAGMVNEGVVSTRLGLGGWPAQGEEMQIARDIALCELTGCQLHIQHITTARGVELVRAAKAAGLPVTCEVTPHHLFLCEDDITEEYDTNLKVNPPLRTRADMLALRRALIAGDIDCVATDHAPHAPHEKALEFELAPFGMTGLETALSLMLTELVEDVEADGAAGAAAGVATDAEAAAGAAAVGVVGTEAAATTADAAGESGASLALLVERMAHAPRRILGLEPVSLKPGSSADLTVIDPTLEWTVGEEGFVSRSRNSGFLGRRLRGRAIAVYIAGYQPSDQAG
ncbi:MAG: dihydroorotase [Coriobacteriales bacterium]|jgi:dihydroorotase|nr:dihydroorotase [Coriobacteriales bacterium]